MSVFVSVSKMKIDAGCPESFSPKITKYLFIRLFAQFSNIADSKTVVQCPMSVSALSASQTIWLSFISNKYEIFLSLCSKMLSARSDVRRAAFGAKSINIQKSKSVAQISVSSISVSALCLLKMHNITVHNYFCIQLFKNPASSCMSQDFSISLYVEISESVVQTSLLLAVSKEGGERSCLYRLSLQLLEICHALAIGLFLVSVSAQN